MFRLYWVLGFFFFVVEALPAANHGCFSLDAGFAGVAFHEEHVVQPPLADVGERAPDLHRSPRERNQSLKPVRHLGDEHSWPDGPRLQTGLLGPRQWC